MIGKYASMGLNSQAKAFDYMSSSFKKTIRSYDFFVAWDKVLANVSQIEVSLNILNSLIGKDNISERFKSIIEQYPEVVSVIPILIAVREGNIKIANVSGDIEYSFEKRKYYSNEDISKIVFFAEQCGLLKIFEDKSVKNLVDYTVGVEVGLDTNARKNRSGSAMESLVDAYIQPICKKHGFEYLIQATASKIKEEFCKHVVTDKADRHFDFAINTPQKLYLIEVNYYSGGGSKLKSVAGEFKTLFELVNNETTAFIWITDGMGWKTAMRPLSETFNALDFVMNIQMIEDGILEEILSCNL